VEESLLVGDISEIYFPLITLERLEKYGKVFKCLKEDPQADDHAISKRTGLFIGEVHMFRLMIECAGTHERPQEQSKEKEPIDEKMAMKQPLEKIAPTTPKELGQQILRPVDEKIEAIVVKSAPKTEACQHHFVTTYQQYDMHGDIRSVVKRCTKCGYTERTHTG
jgi:hypothetical protein